MLQLDKIVCV